MNQIRQPRPLPKNTIRDQTKQNDTNIEDWFPLDHLLVFVINLTRPTFPATHRPWFKPSSEPLSLPNPMSIPNPTPPSSPNSNFLLTFLLVSVSSIKELLRFSDEVLELLVKPPGKIESVEVEPGPVRFRFPAPVLDESVYVWEIRLEEKVGWNGGDWRSSWCVVRFELNLLHDSWLWASRRW